jgi:streptogramin lyase
VTLFPIPSGGNGAGITLGPDNNVWFTENDVDNVGRITPAGAVTEVELPSQGTAGSITIGPDGQLWVRELGFGGALLAAIDPNNPVTNNILEFLLPDFSDLGGITRGPDGYLWLTGTFSDSIGPVATDSTQPVPAYLLNHGSGVHYITRGPDGNMWFTAFNSNQIGKITPAGAVTQFAIPTADSGPQKIVTGPDGNLWFTEDAGQIGRVTPAGAITEFLIQGFGCPHGITVGSDNNLWVADSCGFVERFTPTNPPTETDFPASSDPFDIASGPDGNLWFTEYDGQQIGQITPAGALAEFFTPSNTFPAGITAGPDGNLWFQNQDINGTVGRITPTGVVDIFPAGLSGCAADITTALDGGLWVPDPCLLPVNLALARVNTLGVVTAQQASSYSNSGASGIAVGPDGRLWFTEFNGSRIGRISAISGSGVAIAAQEGAQFSGRVASFVDGTPAAQPSDFTATIDWGDGSAPSFGTVSGPQGGPFDVSGAHVYSEESAAPLNVTVTLHDTVDNEDYPASSTAAVADAPLTAGTFILPTGNCVEGAACSLRLASFIDANSYGAAGDFSAVINWGDGQSSSGTVSSGTCGSEFCVSGSHTYAEEGSYAPSVQVSDIGGSQLSLPGVSVTVADAPLTAQGKFLAAPHGTPLSNVFVASFTDADPNGQLGDYTASIDWGDGSALAAGTISANSKGGFDVSGTHTYSAAGAHTATITIHDVGGSSAVATSPVADDYPLILTVRRVHFRPGQQFMLMVGTVTDTDPNAAADGSNLSATIDWGDGTSNGATLLKQSGSFAIMGSHHYTAARVFTLTVTVTDTDGGAKAQDTAPATLWPLPRSF